MTESGRVRSHRFANRFAHLEPYDRADSFLTDLGGVTLENGEVVGPMLADPEQERAADVDAGIAFFGQFIDHEITLDPTSSLERDNDPRALRNFRTPALDLDSVYGAGPEVRPFLYDDRDPDGAKLLTGPAADAQPTDDGQRAGRFGATDLQRNRQGAAMITDPRNDENLVISQLQLAFIKFHNRVVDYLRSGDGAHLVGDDEDVYEAARRSVRWHYQWLVLREFLPKVCDGSVLDDIRSEGRQYFLRAGDRVAIPVEFAGATYRYGHSQIRDRYTVNDDVNDVQFFPGPSPERLRSVMEVMLRSGGERAEMERPAGGSDGGTRNLNGFEPVPDEMVVEWSYFFDHAPGAADSTAQPARPIDAGLPPALMLLPFIGEGPTSLAARNLLRGAALGLPSGQALAAAMDVDPLSNDELTLPGGGTFGEYLRDAHRGADTDAPLWLYVLAEADRQQNGHRLGALGSRIVAEVIHGLVAADDRAFVNESPDWTPTMPRPVSDAGTGSMEDATGRYRFADLLQFATGPAPDGLRIDSVDADGTGDAPATPGDDPTNGEAVVLVHTGEGPVSLAGYTLDYEEQAETVAAEDAPRLQPGERAVVYTGDGPASTTSVDDHVIALGRSAAAIDDEGETVTVSTPTGEVSTYHEYTS